MRTDFQHLIVQRQGGVLTLLMNRPEVLNAFNAQLLQDCIEAAQAAAEDETVRCVVLAGAGRAFGSGQDLSFFKDPLSEDAGRDHLQHYHRLVQIIHTMPKPVVAALHGVATGISLNIALACDLRIAADTTRFSEGFARIGLVPDGGGAYFLTRLVGLSKALELSLLAEEILAPEAERIGLIHKCVPLSELETTVQALAQRLAEGPTVTYGLIKRLVYAAPDGDLSTIFALESELQGQAIQTADHKEAVAAFLQKRPPSYTGQ
ncbi:enoyl-CoA hydratase/isomerase family protein [Tengunoibacter tsumagoiensis]|uniref:Enoyl-CoA hydratase n=1 Tax=Tengunoibacter tsumagoiensis TaxID=2014871 RepID=A0A402A2G8_9CHLR|nr:enoyl-CoA hydratase-related protein [Tengunoibacter tsumagoiensis]GCE13262.1 enoyl-CoA hydratase [Tengunoibacter tsumagoiensis]